MSTIKQRRRVNQLRRAVAASKQRPLSVKEQGDRAARRTDAHRAEYPMAPTYRTHLPTGYVHDDTPPAIKQAGYTTESYALMRG